MSKAREFTLQILQAESGRSQSVHITQGAKAVTPPDPGHDHHSSDLVLPSEIILEGVYGNRKQIDFPKSEKITVLGDFTYSVDSSKMVPELIVTRSDRGLTVSHSSFEDKRSVVDGTAESYLDSATITITVRGEVYSIPVSLSLPPVE